MNKELHTSESSQNREFESIRQLKKFLSKPVHTFVLKISVEICDNEKQISKKCPICKSDLDLINSKTKSYHCQQCGVNIHHLEGED